MIDYTLPLDELPDPLPIEPLTKPFDVTITPPGSKSITCRAYVLAALADGESKIIRPLRAEDTDLLLDALCTLGAAARWEGDDVYITGVNGRFPRGGEVNLRDGGTPTRFMIACACLAAEPVVVDGSPRMRERPIAEGVDMLRQLGAKIEYIEEEGRLPVRVAPSKEFRGGELTIGKTASSQFISALMLISPWLKLGIELTFASQPTSSSYLALTRALLEYWQCATQTKPPSGWSLLDSQIDTLAVYCALIMARTFSTECDASSSVYWIAATWATPPSKLNILDLKWPPIQPDMLALRALLDANLIDARLSNGNDWSRPPSEFRDYLHVERGRKTGRLRVDCAGFPDGSLALSIVAAQMKSKSVLTGLHTLRVKETDRIAALANELRKVGCEVETTDDSITITPVSKARDQRPTDDWSDPPPEAGANGGDGRSESGGTAEGHVAERRGTSPIIIETYNDHRMAMAFAVLGLAAPGGHTLSIRNPACVKKSYPTFWQDFAKLYQ